jgi:S-disulfanyl-L-cysteine oxidoreductase SoxD
VTAKFKIFICERPATFNPCKKEKGKGSFWLMITTLMVGGTFAIAGPMPNEAPKEYGFGRPATEAEIQAWNIDVSPTGEGLPPGKGAVRDGAKVFAQKCAACHGPSGVEGPADRLIGGQGSLKTPHPVKTVGSYWPYATTLYDYIYRAMPYSAPQSLTPDEVYSVVAWILYRNGIISEDAVMDAKTLPAVHMPNRDGFIHDTRPDTR